MLFNNIYHKKKVLITGNTGFKGSWLSAWLLKLEADVYGLSHGIPTNPSHFEVARIGHKIKHFQADIRLFEETLRVVEEVEPDFVFHLAAQPLVRLSYESPVETLSANIMGSAHILEALRLLDHPCVVIMITSDKCYDNVEWTWGYRETDALGGKDPYSASKGSAELVIKTYINSYFSDPKSKIKVAVGRAGNVIGGGDWALDRLIPDCVAAWSQGKAAEIRSPKSIRPWQHVLEPLSGYLVLGQKLAENSELNGEPFNFGPSIIQNLTVADVIEKICHYWPDGRWDSFFAEENVHEARVLRLCCNKARYLLNWRPILDFEETIGMTMEWYRHYYENPDADIWDLTQKQIDNYIRLAGNQTQAWNQ